MAYKGVLLPNEDKKVEENMKDEDILFSWNSIIWSYSHGNSKQYLRLLATFFPLFLGVSVSFICAYFSDVNMSKKEILTTNIAIAVGMLFFCLLMRVYVLSDIRCTFILKNSGIVIKMKRALSDSSILLIRFIGWSGVAICIIAIIYIGPIAFAGAGMFALSTLKLVSYQSHETEEISIISDKLLVFNVKANNLMILIPYPFYYPSTIYYDDAEMVIKKLKEIYNIVDVYDIEKSSDYMEHPATLESAKAKQDILEEMRNLGVNV